MNAYRKIGAEVVAVKRAMREIDALVSKVSDAKDEQHSSTND